jgi:3-oxoacyl-[acyl-carrier-protein] synthase-1
VSAGRILAVGARSPLGLDARAIALALRAQKLAPRRLVFRDDAGSGPPADGLPVSYGTARAACVPDAITGFDRLVALGAPALRECAKTAGDALPGPCSVHLAVPDARPAPDDRFGKPLLLALAERSGVDVDLRSSTAVAGGHAGFAIALERALAESRTSRGPVFAGAVDSFHDQATLKWLRAEHRLHGSGTTDGFIPSEGAAFALVSADGRGPKLATVEALEVGADESSLEAEDPAIAVAMTATVGRALDAAGEVKWFLVDVNGERHRIKEWSFTTIRHRPRIDLERARVERPYQESGDAGAATGALYVAFACMAWDTGAVTDPKVLVALHSDGPGRAAIVLGAP